MLKMTRRIGRLSGLIAAGVAIVGTGSGVMVASYSAFSDISPSAANSWSTGSVALTNDAIASAVFTAANASQQMSATATKCIKVTSTGSLATTVKLYSTGYTDTGIVGSNPLGTHINLTINVGALTSTGAADCSGYAAGTQLFNGKLADFNTHNQYSNGLAVWSPAGGTAENRVLQFIWSYDAGAPQSTTVNDTFTWEAQGS